MAIKNICLPVLCRKAHHARWDHSGGAGGAGGPWRPPSLAPPEAPPQRPTSRASHLLPECTAVTVVGLGLRSAPTAETPDEEEMKLQSVEGARPAGTVTQGFRASGGNTRSPALCEDLLGVGKSTF